MYYFDNNAGKESSRTDICNSMRYKPHHFVPKKNEKIYWFLQIFTGYGSLLNGG
jgi:hypothetical protein